jgi:tRNA A-37 threonylcarbamoyl transferase component Bud32
MKESFGTERQNMVRKAEALQPASELDDFKDSPELYRLLARIPNELRPKHIEHIENLSDEDAETYLKDILEKREAASRESEISEPLMRDYFNEHSEAVWKALETNVFSDADNLLGAGITARIKRFALKDIDENAPIDTLAIKYLVSPTEKTLSVTGEHDLIREVERIQKIEAAEKQDAESTKHIRVPHPYFYYRNGKIQCYGMEEIDGVNLEQGTSDCYHDSKVKDDIRSALAGLDREALMIEVDRFFDAMHTVCLHGDIKPANMMVSRTGQFYVIDFGQSVLANDIDEKSQDAFENLKDDEKKSAKLAVRYFLDSLKD